ncbi:hypothetical protein KUCAC02_030435, partial [Chaenocephalus aceratus]
RGEIHQDPVSQPPTPLPLPPPTGPSQLCLLSLHSASQLEPGEPSAVVPVGSNTVASSSSNPPFTRLPSAHGPSGFYAVTAAYLWPP